MTKFSVLNAADSVQRHHWLQLWEQWPQRDVNAHPAYAELFAAPNENVVCVTQTDEGGMVLFPLIVRSLGELPWAQGHTDACDLVSPYGYGGPYAHGSPNQDVFWSNYRNWAQSVKAISCFARLSLFPQQQIAFSGQVESALLNVIRTLSLTKDELWQDYEYKVRKNVNKAQRSGLTVTIDPDGDRLDDFLSIYYATMERRDAAATYYFPREFFESIIKQLTGSFVFFHCVAEDRIVSTELILTSRDNIYSFLGGTLPDAYELRPNDILKHCITQWGMETGRRNFVLGGGYNVEDGIFRYKRSFAPHGVVPFYVGKRIENEPVYEQLMMLRKSWEHTTKGTWHPKPGFFPEYRA